MVTQIIFAAGVLLLLIAGYQALMVLRALRGMRRRQAGFFNVMCAGDCASAFEFMLRLDDEGRIAVAQTRGSRCAHSLICAHAACQLAQGKIPAQLKEITAAQIAQCVGGLSPEHMHCAILAAHGLAQAAKILEAESKL